MGWEKRGANRYYTRSRKVRGRVVREYIGKGPEAELAAAMDVRRRRERQRDREDRRERAQRWHTAAAPLEALGEEVARLAEAALLGAGYHQHMRTWRRRRMSMIRITQEGTSMETELPTTGVVGCDAPGLPELLSRARAGDRAVLPALRRALDADPGSWRRYGDLAAQALAAWIDLLAGDDILLRESVTRKLQEMYGELCGPAPTPLEALLVEQVLACWLQSAYADYSYAAVRSPESTPAVRQELMRRQESAQKRLLAAARQLALVRKLLGSGKAPSSSQATLAAPVLRVVVGE